MILSKFELELISVDLLKSIEYLIFLFFEFRPSISFFCVQYLCLEIFWSFKKIQAHLCIFKLKILSFFGHYFDFFGLNKFFIFLLIVMIFYSYNVQQLFGYKKHSSSKINYKFFFYILGYFIFIFLYYFTCNFFLVMLAYSPKPKSRYTLYRTNFKKLFKVKKCQKNAQKTQHFQFKNI